MLNVQSSRAYLLRVYFWSVQEGYVGESGSIFFLDISVVVLHEPALFFSFFLDMTVRALLLLLLLLSGAVV